MGNGYVHVQHQLLGPEGRTVVWGMGYVGFYGMEWGMCM